MAEASAETAAIRTRSESPAKGIELEDAEQETGIIAEDSTTVEKGTEIARVKTPKSPRSVRFQEEQEEAPTKPPRPLSPQQQALITLIEAFPTIDGKVVKAVLTASGGQLEPAFNALLGMSDPDFQEEQPPPRPPRPVQQERQISQDEMFARQLSQHYSGMDPSYNKSRQSRSQTQQPMGERTTRGTSSEERDYSFFDDDLPVIRENVRQGFIQTQSKVNKWINDFSKRINGEEEDENNDLYAPPAGAPPQRQNFGASQKDQLRGIRKNAEAAAWQQGRRSTDHERYDADPRVLSDNFSELELKDEETPPPKPNRPLANPALFRPTNATVAMSGIPPQTGPVDEVDALYHQSRPSGGDKAKGNKKWQPLTSMAPNPDVAGEAAIDEEDENDPFSLGDNSDEDKEKDINEEATERLKNAAAKKDKGKGRALSDTKTLEEHDKAGSNSVRDKAAEDILKS